MSQLACPLCGRFVSLRHFDPSGFESDIYFVNRIGLGRGKGFAVSEMFSVLGEKAITDPIASRCREILGLIEGQKPPRYGEVSVLKAARAHNSSKEWASIETNYKLSRKLLL